MCVDGFIVKIYACLSAYIQRQIGILNFSKSHGGRMTYVCVCCCVCVLCVRACLCVVCACACVQYNRDHVHVYGGQKAADSAEIAARVGVPHVEVGPRERNGHFGQNDVVMNVHVIVRFFVHVFFSEQGEREEGQVQYE